VPITKWLDATSTNPATGVSTEPCDLARLLQVLCDTIRAELN